MKRLRRQWVYRCFDAEGRLLYVGCTDNPERRLGGHRSAAKTRPAHWLHRMTSYKLTGPFIGTDARQRALAVERHLVRTEHPEANVDRREAALKGWSNKREQERRRAEWLAFKEAKAASRSHLRAVA